MDIRYRIRKRKTEKDIQYFVDYKRPPQEGGTFEEQPWMGGFYAPTEEKAKEIIDMHRRMEELRKRLEMDEEIIYDETEILK